MSSLVGRLCMLVLVGVVIVVYGSVCMEQFHDWYVCPACVLRLMIVLSSSQFVSRLCSVCVVDVRFPVFIVVYGMYRLLCVVYIWEV